MASGSEGSRVGEADAEAALQGQVVAGGQVRVGAAVARPAGRGRRVEHQAYRSLGAVCLDAGTVADHGAPAVGRGGLGLRDQLGAGDQLGVRTHRLDGHAHRAQS